VNPAERGAVRVDAGAGVLTLRVSLGALAELETRLGLNSLSELGAHLASPSARDLQVMLDVLAKAGGEDPDSPAVTDATPQGAARAVVAAFQAAGFGQDAAAGS
jgi:hypothetical protein